MRARAIRHRDDWTARSQVVSRGTGKSSSEGGSDANQERLKLAPMSQQVVDYAWRPRLLVLLATLVAFPLRVWPIGQLGLNQFDEGIYAMAAGWILDPAGLAALSPGLIPYGPPGFSVLVGLTSLVIGLSDQSGLLVSAVLGCLTVPIVAGIAQQVFGPRAAAASAWCVCLSGPHIAFSRMGLTDVSFLFVWSLGIAAGLRFLTRPRFSTGLTMGVLVGLAQQFKYNGWLLGALVVANAGLGLMLTPEARVRRHWVGLGMWGGLAVLISAALVYPWYRFVEVHGGYAALLTHQRSYLGPPSSWWPHLRNQIDQAVVLGGSVWLGFSNALLVGVAVGWTDLVPTSRTWIWRSLLVACLVWPLLAAPVSVGLLVVPSRLCTRHLGERFVAVSWVVLLILSPFYHPYARLWLPFELLHWMLLGMLAARSVAVLEKTRPSQPLRWGALSLLAGMGLLAGGSFWFGSGFPLATPGGFNHAGLFAPSDSLRIAAGELVEQIPPEVTGLRTLIRPAMSYYLGGRVRIYPQGDVAQLDRNQDQRQWGLIDSTIVAGVNSNPDEAVIAGLLRRWEIVQAIPAQNTLPTALDLNPGFRGRTQDRSRAIFWLIRLRHSGTK